MYCLQGLYFLWFYRIPKYLFDSFRADWQKCNWYPSMHSRGVPYWALNIPYTYINWPQLFIAREIRWVSFIRSQKNRNEHCSFRKQCIDTINQISGIAGRKVLTWLSSHHVPISISLYTLFPCLSYSGCDPHTILSAYTFCRRRYFTNEISFR